MDPDSTPPARAQAAKGNPLFCLRERKPAVHERSLPRRGDAESNREVGAFRRKDPEQDLLDLIGETASTQRMTLAGCLHQRVAKGHRRGGRRP
ncbi:MAG: hypothetical protein ACO3ZK_06260, partial [Rubrivivax sp.]